MKVCFLILITFQIFFFSLSEDRLVFLYAHYRHGARAPLAINDSFYDRFGEYWDNPGELTGVGQRMLYILGLKNREKYILNKKNFYQKNLILMKFIYKVQIIIEQWKVVLHIYKDYIQSMNI